jgi:demethylmenaquinone methyltransferase/2-methoxy-6-polyprenyl-1,4-benzoquinol methylase
MDSTRLEVRRAFFDGISSKWDGWEDLARLQQRLAAGLDEFGLEPDETVLDVGCGTGNLTLALTRKLSNRGRVVALDLSPGMIEQARRKVPDARVAWHVGTADSVPLPDGSADRAILYSVWPHLEHRERVVAELARILRPARPAHVWHLSSRHRINEIHAGAGEAVRHDVLPVAAETARVFAAAGFVVTSTVDDDDRYLVTAVSPGKE